MISEHKIKKIITKPQIKSRNKNNMLKKKIVRKLGHFLKAKLALEKLSFHISVKWSNTEEKRAYNHNIKPCNHNINHISCSHT